MDVHIKPIAVGTLLLVISANQVQAQCLEPCKPGDANKNASFLFGPNPLYLIVPTLCVGTPLGTLCVQ
ncbi:hypothetical protein [Pseudomonas sp. PB106]|uniref:hypothetical protein n=1 Tax=Pseudomonas sp. PB106 TaxID=2494699 RepID=UPI00131B6A30|nr:hypothetical protein [Pseudomonas sp. PB106]KAE9640858.1 hypothetical protein EJA71_21850 [Pseudomonas sp. PB106]